MRKCSGDNFSERGIDSIFEIECPRWGNPAEFSKDEINLNKFECRSKIKNAGSDYDCSRRCSFSYDLQRNLCFKFRKSKDRFPGRTVF